MTTLADINPIRDSEFHLVKPIDSQTWLAECLPEREHFLTRRLTELDPGTTDFEHPSDAECLVLQLSECDLDCALAQLLNHENILSLAGPLTESAPST